jgi:hypothetical protein
MIEIFVDIKDYEGFYKVSNFGSVKSLSRLDAKGNRRCEKLLKLYLSSAGYYQVSLCRNSRAAKFLVHRLVIEAFVSNIHNKSQVNHRDGNKLDNNVNNLEWVTPSENTIHADEVLGIDSRGENYGAVKLTERDVMSIRDLLESSGYTQEFIAGMFNVDQTTISDVKVGRTWTHI